MITLNSTTVARLFLEVSVNSSNWFLIDLMIHQNPWPHQICSQPLASHPQNIVDFTSLNFILAVERNLVRVNS